MTEDPAKTQARAEVRIALGLCPSCARPVKNWLEHSDGDGGFECRPGGPFSDVEHLPQVLVNALWLAEELELELAAIRLRPRHRRMHRRHAEQVHKDRLKLEAHFGVKAGRI